MRRLLPVEPEVSPRLLGFVSAIVLAGLPLAAGATYVAVTSRPGAGTLAGVLVFFGLALIAELRPVPVDIEGQRLVSLAFVFVVASELLFGWEWSVAIGATAIFVAQLPARVVPMKLFFNSAVYALAAGLASLPGAMLGADASKVAYGRLVAVIVASGTIFVVTNVALVCVAIGLSSGDPIRGVMLDHFRHSGPVFSIMVFIVPQAVIFWRLSPALLILVGAPLFALNLYQRSAVRGRVAQREAETDSLTHLKNFRAYEVEVGNALTHACEGRSPVSLCLIDVDRFKQVNDRHGHPAGDAVLALLGTLVEEAAPGQGYRLGGDEFAVVVQGPASAAVEVAEDLQRRFASSQDGLVPELVTLSTGIACFPEHGEDAVVLKKRADLALYRSKHGGRDRTSVYDPAAESASLSAVLAVSGARHEHGDTQGVSHLVEALGRALGLDDARLELLRAAGRELDFEQIACQLAASARPAAPPVDAGRDDVLLQNG
jgi:diguanylate cyclase (GGDEF)-like protein